MKTYEQQYLALLEECITFGEPRSNRTGTDAYSLFGKVITHNMLKGFPLINSRKLNEKSIRVETDFYLKGYTDKKWLQDRGCSFWNSWQSPEFNDQYDLGPTYGFHWRHWGAHYAGRSFAYKGHGQDQITEAVEALKAHPHSRQVVITQWNPSNTNLSALPPCIFAFQLILTNGFLDLVFYQRSSDLVLGFPNDFAQHALLLHLFAKELKVQAGNVIAMLGLAEVYSNHVSGVRELLSRDYSKAPLPYIETNNFTSVVNWDWDDSKVVNYNPLDLIKFNIAI